MRYFDTLFCMDIEELNKSQIVMLTLLVSFVTSIATGIVTVSLMDQAPPTVTQTINRVVERTIERVVPEETQTATVITQERTVVVKESELIAQAVDRISPSIVSVHNTKEGGELGDFAARGVVVAPNIVVTTLTEAKESGEYFITLSGKKVVLGKVMSIDKASSLVMLSYTSDEEIAVPPAAFVTTAPKLGQTVVALTGSDRVRIANGLVTGFIDSPKQGSEGQNASTDNKLFETSIAQSSLVRGSIVINTDGAVIGIAEGSSSSITPATTILSALSAVGKDSDSGSADSGE